MGLYDHHDGECYETIGNVTATAGKGGLILENSNSQRWTDSDYTLRVRVAGTLNSDVELNCNTMLTVGGAATVGTLTFGETDIVDHNREIAPVFVADRALTLGTVVQIAKPSAPVQFSVPGTIWKKDLSTPIAVKGTKSGSGTATVIRQQMYDEQGHALGEGPGVELRLGVGPTVPGDLKVLTGPSLHSGDWSLYTQVGDDPDSRVYYDNYIYKDALYVGNLAPQG